MLKVDGEEARLQFYIIGQLEGEKTGSGLHSRRAAQDLKGIRGQISDVVAAVARNCVCPWMG